jgi:uncharacterized protein
MPKPVALWAIVIALLLAGGVLMYAIQSLTSDIKSPGRASQTAAAPMKTNTAPAGTPAPVVEVASLRDAIEEGDFAALKAQLDKGVDINAQMQLVSNARRQLSLLSYAVFLGKPDLAKQLLAAGADADATDSTGTTPMMLAAARGDAEMVSALIAAKARVDARDRWGQTALMLAAQSGEQAVVDLLLKAGATVRVSDNEGNTALARAIASEGPATLAKTLVDAGAEVDTPNSEGQTSLMKAAERGDADKVVLLLNAGAKPDLKDNDGRRAADWAQQRNDAAGARVIDLLSGARRDPGK